MMTPLLQVALGGAIGAAARYLTGNTVTRFVGHGFPAGTMVVNVAGSFLMGAFVVMLARKSENALAPFLMTGLLGGFTTFSAFSLDAITLFERGQIGAATGYIVGSVALSLLGLLGGLYVARMVLA